jgi:hypothetical protein
MAVLARIPVRIYYDEEAQSWHFHVPELHIVGGGQRPHDEGRMAAAEAVAGALESQPDQDDDGPYEYLDVAVG